jgi:hypothetical protein
MTEAVRVDNFIRAETDRYCGVLANSVGFGTFPEPKRTQ